ncbi:MAG: hypothetical protein A2W52_00160 [Candidatus Taylorbacteria bacterium RIFCSPHIGHO2_02_49_25]|uniref:Uncharacterized protein n=1 Tax=Candidatus Taylorbacteria bacterium RIFCSPHIGHO2_02_49_25 TaxID=1802305 RepID=A0A1G2MJE2_9BACT|nr:MAG: hypothetical protein UY62_C0003G0008 [Parcubacteria group bacterium GW2011_GWF2_50_9]OHA19722.1 MAG: hypothetical protein A2759_04020 [Candidatus Taylorbacteria bacterium RIFCSPHIGHO2_01_FULL_49_60]OHA23131.1 MAG: hypothetical protein A2W52_00160 [Candidatus Taylorbacteria bacterium RIFCSPHIGHO2_02_49_25]OHA35509.1 MAG: hypothetical protein A3B27_00325 [Candidatus Taylorbacteria bacterium RIFCSPLOWO2_01_FULL_50_130]OHA35591.1 MAG: hypothetical protein A2W65_00850 [Candidatus Taylorbacte
MKESLDFESVHDRTHKLLTGVEQPRNEGEHQIILAVELFTRNHLSEGMHIDDVDFQNRMMYYWISNGYAKAFRDLITHRDFKRKENFRLNGDVLNVTLSDVEYFLQNKELPEQ